MERQPLAGARVGEHEVRGVQGEPRSRQWVLAGVAVDAVGEHRMPEVREMDADLVRAAGSQLGLDQRCPTEALDGADLRDGVAAGSVRAEGGEARARPRSTDLAFDLLLLGKVTGDQRQVPTLDRVGTKLVLKPLGGVVVEGEDEHAGGVLVDAVDDQHAAVLSGLALDRGRDPRQNGVRLARVGRMDEQTGRLVDHHEVVIEVQELDRRSARGTCSSWQVRVVVNLVIIPDNCSRIDDDLLVDQDVSDLHLVAGVRVRRTEQLLDDTGQPPNQRHVRG